MKITFLGTAAAEGLPAVWCNCPTCRKAKAAGGKEIRTRSQILVDDCLLVDFPMDTYMHALRFGLDLSAVDSVLITHSHMDHCYPQEFILHGEPFAHDITSSTVTIYGDKAVAETFAESTRHEMRDSIAPSVPVRRVAPFERFVTRSGYEITALPARHTQGEDCLIYAITHDKKTVLSFNDSGILPEETYDRMAEMGLHFDLVSFDSTYGHARHGEGRHMGALDAADEREKMLARGLADSRTKYILTHFSHNCNLSHAELVETEKQFGFTVAYDGLTVTI